MDHQNQHLANSNNTSNKCVCIHVYYYYLLLYIIHQNPKESLCSDINQYRTQFPWRWHLTVDHILALSQHTHLIWQHIEGKSIIFWGQMNKSISYCWSYTFSGWWYHHCLCFSWSNPICPSWLDISIYDGKSPSGFSSHFLLKFSMLIHCWWNPCSNFRPFFSSEPRSKPLCSC